MIRSGRRGCSTAEMDCPTSCMEDIPRLGIPTGERPLWPLTLAQRVLGSWIWGPVRILTQPC